jgi:MoaA/NifB/PqqE/SkfB family radical SAM enzyme
MFELTYQCNFKCGHCYVPASYKKRYQKIELKTREVFSILDQLKEAGCFYLGFTGGEPFLRKDIMPILWYARERGFQVIIYTNGSLINEKIAKELGSIDPNKVDITIPAISKKAFESISRVHGSHQKVFRAIELLSKNGVRLGFKTCMVKKNKAEIKDIQRFAASLKARHRLDDKPSPSLDELLQIYSARAKLSASGHGQSRSRPIFKCGVGELQAAITPAGELKMCVMLDEPKYNILNSSLEDAWKRLRGSNKYYCIQCPA